MCIRDRYVLLLLLLLLLLLILLDWGLALMWYCLTFIRWTKWTVSVILSCSVFTEFTSCLSSNISCILVSFISVWHVYCLILKLSLTIRLPTSSEYSLELDLARAVVPEQSQVKILSSRVLVCTLFVFANGQMPMRCDILLLLSAVAHSCESSTGSRPASWNVVT